MLRILLSVICVVVVAGAAYAGSETKPKAPHHGLSAVQSDSACAAYVPDADLNAYIAKCALLIAQLSDALDKCGRLDSFPMSAQQRYDAENYCTPFNLNLVKVQLAAARNDRAYFLIQCGGKDNFNLALADLRKALDLMGGKYWLAQRNRAVAYMLLGKHKEAEEDFISLLGALEDVKQGVASGQEPDAKIFIRPTSEAELRLGRGLALIGKCDFKGGQDELVAAESLTRGPIGTNMELYTISLFGQGLTWKMKSWEQRRLSRSNAKMTTDERERIGRYADSLEETGTRRMDAARSLIDDIVQLVADRFHIEERNVQANCSQSKATS